MKPRKSKSKAHWWLKSKSEVELPSVDYVAPFELPALETPAPPPPPDDTPRDADEEAALDFETATTRLGAVLQRDESGDVTLLFRAGRNRGRAVCWLAAAAGWTWLTAWSFASSAPWYVKASASAFELLVLAAAGRYALLSRRLKFGPGGVTTEWRVLGLGRRRHLAPPQIRAVYVERSGTRFGVVAYRQVIVATADNTARLLVGKILRPIDAERLAREIRAAIGLRSQPGDRGASFIDLEADSPDKPRGDE
jgi:hypothetical protein